MADYGKTKRELEAEEHFDGGYRYVQILTKEGLKRQRIYQKKLRTLVRIENKLRKRAALAAKPWLTKANKVHRDWVKVYEEMRNVSSKYATTLK